MIYAINRQTKEHRIVSPNDENWDEEWRCAHADDDGWIVWQGGECPLPDDADYEVRHKDGEVMSKRVAETFKGQWARKGLLSDIITYRPILNAEPSEPEAVEWDGVGLPPVGTECNCWHTGSHQGAVTVRYMGSEMCVLLNHDIGEEQCGPIEAYRFEPLRTAAQRAEDEAVEDMMRIYQANVSISVRDALCDLYRAGYRKGQPT